MEKKNVRPGVITLDPNDPKAARMTNLMQSVLDLMKNSNTSLEEQFSTLASLHFSWMVKFVNDYGGRDELLDMTLDHMRKAFKAGNIDVTGTVLDNDKSNAKNHHVVEINDGDIAAESDKKGNELFSLLTELCHKITVLMNDGGYDIETEFWAALTIFGNISAGVIKAHDFNPNAFILSVLKHIDEIWEQHDLHVNAIIMPTDEKEGN